MDLDPEDCATAGTTGALGSLEQRTSRLYHPAGGFISSSKPPLVPRLPRDKAPTGSSSHGRSVAKAAGPWLTEPL